LICPSCGTQNIADANFCMECASPLAGGCPSCGFANPVGAKFCAKCATPLTATAPTVAAVQRPAGPVTHDAASVSERKLVTVLFADLVGFTPFAEERDSEDVRDTLSRYFDIAREVVGRYGGTVEKFIGDAVMAVWGAPVAQEDDAERAVRAAMDLVDAVPALGPGIQARAGVLTGEAAITIGATNQGMVAGDLVNTASRLQSAAEPGTVLVGGGTQRATSAAISYEEAGEQTLKGKQAPVAAWRALRVVAERGGRNRSEQLEAPFVGRQEEFRLLKDMLHATAREQRVRVVSVIGPAGIGKSRLAWELSKYVDGLAGAYYWHSGRSPAYGEGVTFWALGEMVRERCELVEGDDEQTTRAKVVEAVARYVADPEEREWVGRALLSLLGVEGGMAAEQLFGAWRTFFERIAAQGTVALVFEDLHFADEGLLDFIDHLLEWSRGVPLYVVTLARPELIERRPDWGGGKRHFVSLHLDPLPDVDMRELLAGLVPGLPEKPLATIVERAGGIPLYAVETVRTLVAEGRLVERDGKYVASGDLTELAVPQTLTALIAARLDMLDEADRRLVHEAAVLGQSFTSAALAAVAGVPQAELEQRLSTLVRRELFERQMNPRSPERGQYGFIQALIREVAYNTLSKKDRKRLHLAAARYFEALDSDEIAGVLASHYLAAHANAAEGQEAEALAGQARIALRAAADRASALGSFGQAADFLRQALAITDDPSEQARVLLGAAEAGRAAGRDDAAEADLREVIELGRQARDPETLARATAQLGELLYVLERPEEAVALLDPAVAELADVDEVLLAELKIALTHALASTGDRSRALTLIDEVLSTAERRGFVSVIANGLTAKTGVLWVSGRRREALGVLGAARQVAIENGMTDLVVRTALLMTMGTAEIDLREAVTMAREDIDLARRTGLRNHLMGAVVDFGYLGFLAGEWDDALAQMEGMLPEEISDADRLGLLSNALIIHADRGESIDAGVVEMEQLEGRLAGSFRFAHDPLGNAALARGDFAEARQQFLALSSRAHALEVLYRAWRPALWSGDVGGAQELQQRFAGAGGFGRIHEARRATISAGMAAAAGKASEALAAYREALRNWRATGSVWDEALTGIDMAHFLDPHEPEVAEVIASSRAILERLRAKPYLDRLNAEASRQPAALSPKTATRPEIAITE
jgi:class 3 adenylate cyclase/tetratricopeptide (TPR) repeat protein